MYITLWKNFRGHPENVTLFVHSFLRKLMVSDKKIHRAFRTHTTLFKQNPLHLQTFLIFTLYPNCIGFNHSVYFVKAILP